MPEQTPQKTSQIAEPAVEQTHSRWALIRLWVLLVAVAGAVIGLDQVAKTLVSERLALGQSWEPIPQIAGFIRVTHSQNTGAAFGMLAQASNAILLVAIVAIAAFIISYPRLSPDAWLSRLGIAMIIGGAFSNNVLDRLSQGYVTDYVHVQLTPALSNVSNFADHAVVVGAALLILNEWLNGQEEDHNNAEELSRPPGPGMTDEGSLPASPDAEHGQSEP
jgi:signal peptidase II